jgi:hypothetical protein
MQPTVVHPLNGAHLLSGALTSTVGRQGGIIRYQPTKASSAAWRGFIASM